MKLVPYGLLATKKWLLGQGLERHSIDNLVKSGQLKTVSRGVFTRSDAPLKWQGVVSSLQRMGSNLTVGGLSALELQGFAHYLPLGDQGTVHLYGRSRLPPWVNHLRLRTRFLAHNSARLFAPPSSGTAGEGFTVDMPWGDESWTIRVSTPEKSALELLQDVPSGVSFEHAEQLMQGLSTLSPRRLESLLRETRSVKAKRLFFWLAERQNHAWMKKLDASAFDLGSGKRVLAKGGKLDKKYRITVPEEMYG
jgi:hypothetical protein